MAPRIALGALVALLVVGFTVHVRWLLSLKDLPEAVGKASGWLHTLAGDDLPAVSLVVGPFAALLAIVSVMLVHFGMPQVWQSARRSLQVGGLLGACLAAAWLIGKQRLSGLLEQDWLYFIPVVPPALLAFQALTTWRQRPRSVGDFRIGVSAKLRKALEDSGDVDRFEEVHRQLLRVFGGVVNERAAGRKGAPAAAQRGSNTPTSFATQFAVPGLLLLLVGFEAARCSTRNKFACFGSCTTASPPQPATKTCPPPTPNHCRTRTGPRRRVSCRTRTGSRPSRTRIPCHPRSPTQPRLATGLPFRLPAEKEPCTAITDRLCITHRL